MSIPTLIVGLGGTGSLTVRALKWAYEQLPETERTPAGFLAIDFDRSALEDAAGDKLAELAEDEYLYLQPESIQEPLANLDRTHDDTLAWKSVHKWFPSRKDVQIPVSEAEANGAGQFRALGRLGFFLHADRIQNTLRKSYEALPCEIDATNLSRSRRVIVAASVAGGTGSGMLIDLAYLARRRLSERPRVYAYLLLPEVFAEVDQGGRIYQNAYAALRELAHLKDQQIPFEGDYWKINPLSVPVGAEEPFTRIFLFGRQLCPDGDPVIGSCREIAETILAQLNPTIQEKTLSVVANTASANTTDERHRRRTHCFSTAGSDHLKLGVDEINSEVILRHITRIMQSDEQLREVFGPALAELTERAQQALEGDADTAEPKTTEREEEDEDEKLQADASARARRLSQRFNETMSTVAEDGRDVILEWLKAQLDQARTAAASEYDSTVDRAWQSIENLYDVLIREGEEAASTDEQRSSETASGEKKPLKESLDELRTAVPPFEKVERSIHRHVNSMLQVSRDVQDPRELLVRHLFVNELLKHLPYFVVWKTDTAPRDTLQRHWETLEQQKKRLETMPWWQKILLSRQEKRLLSLGRASVLNEARSLPALATTLKAVFLARAAAELRGRLRREARALEKALEKIRRPWDVDLVDNRALPSKIPELPTLLKEKVDALLRDRMRPLLREASIKIRPRDDDSRRRDVLRRLLREQILDDQDLRRARFVVDPDDESQESSKKRIVAAYARARQDIFVRRTPNPQRKGFAVVLAPEGVVWPDGEERLRRFLDASAEQILECRAQVVSHRGERLWFYFEDLFNPPEHIRNLDDYYHAYASQAYPELFHIDRRLLENADFRHIFSGSHRLVAGCGNAGCSANIAYEKRSQRICPECHRTIRSRCGNSGCTLEELHRHPKGKDRKCPACGEFNHAAWWRCEQHGKKEVLVPSDKPRCPRCVARHHEDPVAFPDSKIGRRPDTVGTVECPNCERLRSEDPAWDSFYVRADLLPFFRNGVNGHDHETFQRLARDRYELPDEFRCPTCRTMLIPVHHREMRTGRVR